MTEEQIKQNAHTYTNDHGWTWDDSGESRVDISGEISDAYLAGAHSRDEEIEQLKSDYHDMFITLAQKVEQLRNPWISVKDRLPEEPLTICAVWLNGDDLVPHISLYDSGRFLLLPIDVTVTHWMAIPQLPLDERLINGLREMNEHFKKGSDL